MAGASSLRFYHNYLRWAFSSMCAKDTITSTLNFARLLAKFTNVRDACFIFRISTVAKQLVVTVEICQTGDALLLLYDPDVSHKKIYDDKW